METLSGRAVAGAHADSRIIAPTEEVVDVDVDVVGKGAHLDAFKAARLRDRHRRRVGRCAAADLDEDRPRCRGESVDDEVVPLSVGDRGQTGKALKRRRRCV